MKAYAKVKRSDRIRPIEIDADSGEFFVIRPGPWIDGWKPCAGPFPMDDPRFEIQAIED